MGRKSVKGNKNAYQLYREEAGLTREAAAEQMYLSPDRIEKVESEKSPIRPDEVLSMSRCYKHPELCNYYCSQECPIGQEYVPQVDVKDLGQIVLEVLASLNVLSRQQERLIEISVDGKLTEDEYRDFIAIRNRLVEISRSVSSLQLWLDKTIADGEVDAGQLEALTK